MGLLLFDDPQVCQDAKFPLHCLKGEAGLMHDLPLVVRFSRMRAKKVQDPRPRGGTKEFHHLLVFIGHVCLARFAWLIGLVQGFGLDWSA